MGGVGNLQGVNAAVSMAGSGRKRKATNGLEREGTEGRVSGPGESEESCRDGKGGDLKLEGDGVDCGEQRKGTKRKISVAFF